MIKIENVQICGWEPTIRGMRNPLNSWAKSDTFCGNMKCQECPDNQKCELYHHDLDGGMPYRNTRTNFHDYIGPNDKDLMERLAKGGPAHAKYRRFITVYLDILAPLYWWKEFETYKVGTDSNSCSTMHKLTDKEFTLDDFSHEHLFDRYGDPSMNLNYGWKHPTDVMRDLICVLNHFRKYYLITTQKLKRTDLTEAERKHTKAQQKLYWWQMIQLLPSSYNQRRTIKLNYETLYRIYHDRKGHKLDEWNEFCAWIESLPLSEVITGPSLKDIPICNEIMEEAMRRIVYKFARENILSEAELKKILGVKSPSGKDDSHLIDLTRPDDDHLRYGILPGYSYEDLTDEEKKLLIAGNKKE